MYYGKLQENSDIMYFLPHQIDEMRREAPIAYIPMGSLEWHDAHLPVGLDGLKVHRICQYACKKTGGFVFPTTFWGMPGKHRPGGVCYNFTSFTEETLSSLYRELISNISTAGFEIIVCLTGHFPSKQMKMLREVITRVELPKATRLFLSAEYELVEDLGYTGGHAGKWETSIMLYLFPELVHLDLLPEDMPFDEFECIRGIDPRNSASAEIGKQLLEGIVNQLVSIGLNGENPA